MNNIIFIGMPAAGKSTIGVVTAKRMGYRFIDTDLLIQEQEGMLLREIIARRGIDAFLDIEDRANAGLKAEKSVIAPGGSVIYCKNAMEHYKDIGKIVYLQASFETINNRLNNVRNRGVVLKEGQTLEALYQERIPFFEKYADITVCEDGCDLGETVEHVLKALKAEQNIKKYITD